MNTIKVIAIIFIAALFTNCSSSVVVTEQITLEKSKQLIIDAFEKGTFSFSVPAGTKVKKISCQAIRSLNAGSMAGGMIHDETKPAVSRPWAAASETMGSPLRDGRQGGTASPHRRRVR